MKTSKAILVPLLMVSVTAFSEPITTKPAAAVSVQPTPTTIGELAEQARQKRIAEETKPVAPVTPPGMTIVPSTDIVNSGAAAAGQGKAPGKKTKPTRPPEVVPGLLAIAKTAAGVRYVELADENGANKYTVGQVTASGWIVALIGAQFVQIEKPAQKKKPARLMTLTLVTP